MNSSPAPLSKQIRFDPSEHTTASLPIVVLNRVPAPALSPRVSKLMEWRQENAELHHRLRVEGIRRSEKVLRVLRSNHTGTAKLRWKASISRNPKFQASTRHVAAKEWTLRAPDGQLHTFRNLRHFIRENEELFDAADILWKPQGRSSTITWCPAYQALARLRPGRDRTLESWQGWTWATTANVENAALLA